jgi:hypothetical protein
MRWSTGWAMAIKAARAIGWMCGWTTSWKAWRCCPTTPSRASGGRYQLVDMVSGEIMLDASDGSDAGIDVVSSEYATIAAENTALENLSKDIANRIVTRIALQLRRSDAGSSESGRQ